MGDVGRASDRGGGGRAGAVHGDRRLRARLPGIRGETEAGVRGQLMSLTETLSWPFFEEHHRRFADELARWADRTLPGLPHDDVDEACRARVAALGKAGFLKACVPAEYGGRREKVEVRGPFIPRRTASVLGRPAGLAFALPRRRPGALPPLR